MECLWCGNIIQGVGTSEGFCSAECRAEANAEYELYLDKYNDYMAGYDVTFEKIRKAPKKKFDRDGKREDQ